MKSHILPILITTLFIAFSFHGMSQMEIQVNVSGVPCDSIKIQSYNWKKKSGTNFVKPYSPNLLFKDKKSLKPGMYWLTADTNHIATFIVPSEKKQKLSMTYAGDSITFEKSTENTLYQQYIKTMRQFDKQLMALDNEYRQSQNLPPYMLRGVIDSLQSRAIRITKAKQQYEKKIIADNPGTLLASVVATNIALPDLPQEYYGDREKMQAFFMEHFFDDFPWNDPRIFNTPIGEDKLRYFCQDIVYQWDNPKLDTFIIQNLEKALQINKETHLNFFDRLEADLGFYMSNYKVEHTYIKMLQHILRTRPDIDKVRLTYYEFELRTINKNVDGSIATDFRFLTDSGDSTSLLQFPSEYTLLLFHNPNCHTCRTVRHRLAQDDLLNKAIGTGRINVLTIYLENDKALWEQYMKTEAAPNYKHGWNFDLKIENEDLYETRTIPYMYLLDKDKKIIRKNILHEEIDRYLKELGIIQ